MTPSGIEPATFRFVAQHLNHCAIAVRYSTKQTTQNKETTRLLRSAMFYLRVGRINTSWTRDGAVGYDTALQAEPKVPGFESQWCHWNFSLT